MTDLQSWQAERIDSAVQARLDDFVSAHRGRLADLGPDVATLIDQASIALRGGKRLRAAFTWWGYGCVAEPDETTVAASAAMELLHASALVHDDLIDDADTRRGEPAAHIAFARQAADWPGDATGYGAAGAILLGDLLLSWADELLRTCGAEAGPVLAALGVLDVTRREVIAGQFLDVTVQARGHADVAEAMRVARYKSAKYSIERPLHIGAALAGGSHLHEGLSAFAVPLGEAFQLRDDVLGVFGEADATGKPAGGDLVEGKRTVLVAFAMAALAEREQHLLNSLLGRPLDVIEVAEAQELIEDSGALAQVESLITELTEQALAGLESLTGIRDEARVALTALAEAATQRSL